MGITVELDAATAALAEKLVAEGRFASIADAVAAGVQQLALEDDAALAGWTVEELRAALAEADAGGPDLSAEQVFAEMRAMLEERYGVGKRK
jgi:Arc/MetJ-type ribon-helix-helix transcriptional regulator